MPHKQPDPDLELLWRDRIARWRDSGLSARAFCAAEKLAEASFYSWRREIQRRDACAAPPRPAFLPVKLAPPSPLAAPPQADPLELLVAGLTLRVRPGFDPALLHAVLAALETRPC